MVNVWNFTQVFRLERGLGNADILKRPIKDGRTKIMYTRDEAKLRATKLRAILKDQGTDITHSNALEVIAQQSDYKDWNTCVAALEVREKLLPPPKGWALDGPFPEHYEYGRDPTVFYKGTNVVVIRVKKTVPPDLVQYVRMIQTFDAKGYRGQRVQFTAPLKCDDNDRIVTIWLRAHGKQGEVVAYDNLSERGIGTPNGPITGTTDWGVRSIVVDIPETTEKTSLGFMIAGLGAGYCWGFSLNAVSPLIPLTSNNTGLPTVPANMPLDI